LSARPLPAELSGQPRSATGDPDGKEPPEKAPGEYPPESAGRAGELVECGANEFAGREPAADESAAAGDQPEPVTSEPTEAAAVGYAPELMPEASADAAAAEPAETSAGGRAPATGTSHAERSALRVRTGSSCGGAEVSGAATSAGDAAATGAAAGEECAGGAETEAPGASGSDDEVGRRGEIGPFEKPYEARPEVAGGVGPYRGVGGSALSGTARGGSDQAASDQAPPFGVRVPASGAAATRLPNHVDPVVPGTGTPSGGR
jgi:pilus assembly protein FimV